MAEHVHRARPAAPKRGEWLVDFARRVKDAIEARTTPLREQLAEQAKRIEALEAKLAEAEAEAGQMRWTGPYTHTRTYRPGDVCQRKDTLWICEREPQTRPGEGNDWRMLVRPFGGDERKALRELRQAIEDLRGAP